jgi:hypothetical protein
MDTLCIPVGTEYSEARYLAILSLTRVFSDASTVLVLDMELVDVSTTVSYLEKELRMITSDWMRRVWTFQEALLTRPGNLYWQFKEQHSPLTKSGQIITSMILCVSPTGRARSREDYLSYLPYRGLHRASATTFWT